MYKYKLTVSDLEIEFFNHQIEVLNKIAQNKNKEEVFFNFFNDIWNDLIDDFIHENIDEFNQINLSYITIKNNKLRSYEILEELSTYTSFNLFTESHIESETELNIELFKNI